MKLTKTSSSLNLTFTKDDWIKIGQQQGWLTASKRKFHATRGGRPIEVIYDELDDVPGSIGNIIALDETGAELNLSPEETDQLTTIIQEHSRKTAEPPVSRRSRRLPPTWNQPGRTTVTQ